jgi:hypothetical protein
MTSLHEPFKPMHVLIGLSTPLSPTPPRLDVQAGDSTKSYPMERVNGSLIWATSEIRYPSRRGSEMQYGLTSWIVSMQVGELAMIALFLTAGPYDKTAFPTSSFSTIRLFYSILSVTTLSNLNYLYNHKYFHNHDQPSLRARVRAGIQWFVPSIFARSAIEAFSSFNILTTSLD